MSPFLLLLALLGAARAARVPGSPFPVCARGLNASRALSVLFTDGLSRDDQLLALTLQGVLSRTAPRMYRLAESSADYQLWLNATRDTFGVALDFSFARSLPGLLGAHASELAGYALASLDDNSTNVALAAAAAAGVVAVTEANEATAVAAGLKRAFDLRGKSVEWALAQFNNSAGFVFSSRVAVLQDPSKLCMGDYAIAAGAVQFWSPLTEGSSLVASVLDALQPPFAVLGWGPDEFHTVDAASRRGGVVIASDWASNLDVLSAFDLPALVQKPAPAAAAANEASPVHTVCFLMSDGDNAQWDLGGFATGSDWFGSPDRGAVPMGWTTSPALADLAPVVLSYLYGAASDGSQPGMPFRDVFVAGVSGVGYSYPDDTPPGPLLGGYASLTAAYMKKAGLRIANVMSAQDRVEPGAAAALLASEDVDALLWYHYDDYAGEEGRISFVHGKPVIGARFALWGSGSPPDPTGPTFKGVSGLADALRALPADPSSASGYSLVALHAWSHNVSDAREVLRLAAERGGSAVEAVAPDEFVRRIVANLGGAAAAGAGTAGAAALPLAPPPADRAAAAVPASRFAAPFPESLYSTIAAAANATTAQLGPGPAGLYSYPTNGKAPGAYGWATSSSGGWTSGFFPSIFFKLWERSGLTNAQYFEQANARAAGLASQQFNKGTHDVGFMVYTPFGAQYRLSRNASALRIILQTAESLCTRFSPKVGCTESWGTFPPTNDVFEVIADNMMNLEVLWFAGTYSQNQTILDIANSHTRRMMKDIFQPAAMSGGGCVWHLLTYSYSTGELRNRSSTPQGLGLDTVWSRGQAWVVNGFAIAHRFTGDLSYLAQAQSAAECYIRKVSACCGGSSGFSWAPLWDFSVTNPGPQVAVDTSAAMIAADGIIEIAWRSDAATRARYLAFAKASIDAVLAQYTFAPAANDAVLNNGTTSWPSAGISIIYADYYLLEAAMRWDSTPSTWRGEAADFLARNGERFVA